MHLKTLLLAASLVAVAQAQTPERLSHTFSTPRGPLLVRAASPGGTADLPLNGAADSSDFIPLGQGVEGDAPVSIALTPDGATALVACRDTDSLELYDAGTGARRGAVVVGERPVHVAVTPDGARAIVACHAAQVLTVVDVAAGTVLRQIPVAGRPYRVAPLADSTRAVVGLDPGGNFGRFSVVDVTTGQILKSFATPPQSPPAYTLAPWAGYYTEVFADFAVTPDETRIVLPSYYDATIRIFDLATGSEVAQYATPNLGPSRVDVSRSGAFAAVSCYDVLGGGNGRVVRIDLATLQRNDIGIGAQLFVSEVRVTPDEKSVLVGTYTAVDVIDVASGAITGTLPGGSVLGAIEFTHDDAFAITAFWDASIVDLATLTVVGSVPASLMQVVAVDPTAHHAVTLSPVVDERIEAFTTDGANAQPTWAGPVGVPVEVDGPYDIALTGDGRRAVVACGVSENLAIVDLAAGVTHAVVPTNGPSHAVAVSPVDDIAVAALDTASAVAIVDLAGGQTLVELPVTGEPRDVCVSQDGTRAYVRSQDGVTGTLTFVDLAGAASVVTSEIVVPDAWWNHLSLSPDGATLAAVSPVHGVTLVDTAAEAIVKQFPTSSSATDFAWSADGATAAWSTGHDGLSVAQIAGASSTVNERSGVGLGLAIAMDAAGEHVYLLSAGGGSPRAIRVFDTSSLAEVAEVLLPGDVPVFSHYPHWAERVGDQLVVARTEPPAMGWRLSLAGAATAVLEELVIPSEGTYDLAVSTGLGCVVLPASIDDDGLRLVDLGGSWTPYCGPAVPNSTGVGGVIDIAGTLLAGAQPFQLAASDLPPLTFGYFLVADGTGFQMPPGSQGNLCLGGSIGRFADDVASTGTEGRLALDVDLTALPMSPPTAVQPGDVWFFQAWFRDKNPTPTSNFTDGAQVTFR